MYESYILLSCEDYKIMQVTTPTTSDPKPFVSSEKESLFLPKEMPSIQVDYTTYYYTTESDLPGEFDHARTFQRLVIQRRMFKFVSLRCFIMYIS